MACLIFSQGAGRRRTLELRGERVTIGRADDNTLALDDRAVSRHHAEVVAEGGRWVVRDLESRNGIRVNGRRVRRATLADGDTVVIGETTLRFTDTAAVGLGPLRWVPVVSLRLPWPVEPGPGLHEEPLVSETVTHCPVGRHPLVPDETALAALRKQEIVQRALLFQTVHAALLAAPDAGALWAQLLALVLRITEQPWAGVLLPARPDAPLRLQLHGESGASAEAPLAVLEAAARADAAVHWSALTEHGDEPMKAFVAVPWGSADGPGGLLFGPATRLSPSDVAPRLQLLAGLALEAGHWWPTLQARWSGQEAPAAMPTVRPLPRLPPAL